MPAKLSREHFTSLSLGWLVAGSLVLSLPLLQGCGAVVGALAAQTLASAVLNQDDPEVVAGGLPAYMLMVDGFIQQSPENKGLLAAGAQLFALYGSRFESDLNHAVVLTAKGRRYGERAMCIEHPPACNWRGMEYDLFVGELAEVGAGQKEVLYSYAVSWLSHLDTASNDWSAVAELPWVQAAMERLLKLDETYQQGGIHVYLGILNALRPPALGGRPEVAKAHFERALELSEGKDLSAKVEYARRYARMVFNQQLHDKLLAEVLEAPVSVPGLTLFNVLAQREAAELLESSGEYF
ncbi:MAG: TRAP transporter TatT component family protein [Gammaproteobacteria bacterium]